MQEHIRRAHPEYYIPKLPATEESFQLMINSPPTARPPPSSLLPPGHSVETLNLPNGIPSIIADGYGNERDVRYLEYGSPGPARTLEDATPMAATAAVALAQLHSQGQGANWDHVGVRAFHLRHYTITF